jgi:multidrug efflux pump subunit AcrA (membrane-fusion protein)
MRPVATGQRQGELVVIDHGVQSGERVVVAGHIGVMPGGKVHVDEPAPRAAAAMAPAQAAVSSQSRQSRQGGKS